MSEPMTLAEMSKVVGRARQRYSELRAQLAEAIDERDRLREALRAIRDGDSSPDPRVRQEIARCLGLSPQDTEDINAGPMEWFAMPAIRGAITDLRAQLAEAQLAAQCPECEGRGEVLDAPSNVLDGYPYDVPCEACGGKKTALAAWDAERAARQQAEAQRDRSVAALRDVEWVWDSFTHSRRICPWCDGESTSGHTDTCPRQAALRETE